MSEHHFLGSFTEQVVLTEEIPPRAAKFGMIPAGIPKALQERLPSQLFAHQSEAIRLALNGKDVLAVTGTNSGKSLCFQVPAITHCLQEPMARAMFIYPTKALAQDQLSRLNDLCLGLGIKVGTYDGDTPKSHRSSIRSIANIVLTNPDMLHTAILPSHELWVKYLKSLRLIALDELHTYRGVFGSHVALILRRLLRLCEWHGSHPQIIAGTATINNPHELFTKLTGREPQLVSNDGSPAGKRTLIFFNPPKINEETRLSPNKTTAEVFSTLIETGVPTITFNRSRIGTELVLRLTKSKLDEKTALRVESYRGGYTPKERRKIEQDLLKGNILGISATNALELGINIGHLDAVIINTFPGSVSSFWQQVGRAGRGEKDSLALYVAGDNPLEQFLLQHPERLLDRRSESVTIQPENPNILRGHLLCAAHERPIAPSELIHFGDSAIEKAEELDRTGELSFQSGRFFYPAYNQPAQNINIRSASNTLVTLYVGEEGKFSEELGSMEYERALSQCHQGAVYLHRGESYQVHTLDLQRNEAYLYKFDEKYYTQSKMQSMLEPGKPFKESGCCSVSGCKVTDLVIGYQKKTFDGDTVIDTIALELPPVSFDTICVRFDLPQLDFEAAMEDQIAGVHALEHALLSLAPLFAGCDRNDLGSAWFTVHMDTMCPAVFIFDRCPGGIGLAESLFNQASSWLQSAYQTLTQCTCENGCPSCLYLSQCEIGNEQLNKSGAIKLLRWIMEQ